MSDPLTSVSIFTSDPTKQDEEGEDVATVVKESKLRRRRRFQDLPKIEEIDCKYRDLILTLPFEKSWGGMRQYEGFWWWEKFIPGILKMQEAFKPRPSDIIIASFPKSGTTWLKALVFSIVHRNKYKFSDHPLLKLSPHDCVRQLEEAYGFQDEQYYIETLPVPRLLATHEAYSTLPESVKASESRIIYICREPKDVLVSFRHMICALLKELNVEPPPFSADFELFCMGSVPCGPMWDHVLEYYMKSLHEPNKILFLKYEEMMSNPIDGATRIANFVGSSFSEEEVKNGMVEEIVRFCSFEKMKELDVSKNVGVDDANNHYYFRRAVVGDWHNHMTPEMATKLDEIIRDKLKCSGFTF